MSTILFISANIVLTSTQKQLVAVKWDFIVRYHAYNNVQENNIFWIVYGTNYVVYI
jgi:hypothetical protein